MANLFSYKNGDLATVMFKKRVTGIGWSPDMDHAVGKTGTIVEPYLRLPSVLLTEKKVVGYRVQVEGLADRWIYPTECLQPAYPMKFEEGETVVVWRKPEDRELLLRHNWVASMDKLVGEEGIISDTPEDGSYRVTIEGEPRFYFPMEALARPASIEQEITKPVHKPMWFLGEISGKPYRSVSRDENGYYTVEDEDGVQSYAKYMRIYEAPYDCKSFSYRVPQPQ